MIFLSVAALVPSAYVRSLAQADPEKLNQTFGRVNFYFSKTTIPVVFFIIMPLLVYAFNSKIRRNLIRELNEIFKHYFPDVFNYDVSGTS